MGRKINIGCGEYLLPGFENIDGHAANNNVIVANALEYNYHGAEIVYAGHFLEHLEVGPARELLRRVIAHTPDGAFIITVPALDRCLDVPFWWLQQVVFGGRRYPGDEHRSAWRTIDLRQEMEAAGYKNITEWADCPYLPDKVTWQVCLKGLRM